MTWEGDALLGQTNIVAKLAVSTVTNRYDRSSRNLTPNSEHAESDAPNPDYRCAAFVSLGPKLACER